MNYFHYKGTFELEAGGELPELTIAYHTYGNLNKAKDNVVWVCHALTASSHAAEWWPGVVGNGAAIDPDNFYIVCANILGSCYGTTGPLSSDPRTNAPYFHDFPMITIRDMVRAHQLLRDHLQISQIHLLMGGSMGGYQALEWALMEPERIQKLFLIATSARETAWGIAIHTAQRLAIEADDSWKEKKPTAGQKGLRAARAIGMLTYRGYDSFIKTQSESDNSKIDHFKATSYILHQGNKLVNRFNAFSYWHLTKALDSHNISRGRTDDVPATLHQLRQPTLIIAINSDILCPLPEMQTLADHIPDNEFHIIGSPFGHDGFLVEATTISQKLNHWLCNK